MNGRNLPVWLKPENEHRITRQRLRSLGPVSDLSKPLGSYSEDVSQSLQSFVQHGTPIAAVQPLLYVFEVKKKQVDRSII